MEVVFQERRWADMPNVTFTFDCTDRPIGFYADLEFDCMVRSHFRLLIFLQISFILSYLVAPKFHFCVVRFDF